VEKTVDWDFQKEYCRILQPFAGEGGPIHKVAVESAVFEISRQSTQFSGRRLDVLWAGWRVMFSTGSGEPVVFNFAGSSPNGASAYLWLTEGSGKIRRTPLVR